MKAYFHLFCLFSIFLSSSFAQSRYKLPCDTAQDAWAGRICAGEEHKKAEIELNSKYSELLRKIRACKASIHDVDTIKEVETERLVINSQNNWREYYNSACKLRENLWEGGSGISQAVSTIATQLIRERILELDDLLSYYNYW